MALYIDTHVLQTVPPSNINRDDTGSPKTAVFGGVRRARVSSQSWKRATRLAFSDAYDESDLGVRTKRVVELVAEAITARSPELKETAATLATEAVTATGLTVSAPRPKKGVEAGPEETGYLVFLSRRQVERLADLAVSAAGNATKIDPKAARAIVKESNSIDVALFGRMIADVTDLNVDAACQVAHAIGTHAVEPEFDFFTAVDDHKKADAEEDAGAGMIGTVEFSSSTLYRFATVNVNQLRHNLGDREATLRAVTTFIDGFVRSMPTGKLTTFGNRTVPELVYVTVREDQPVSLVGAFETPVSALSAGGYSRASSEALATHAAAVEAAYGNAPAASWVIGVGPALSPWAEVAPSVTFDELLGAVRGEVDNRVGETE